MPLLFAPFISKHLDIGFCFALTSPSWNKRPTTRTHSYYCQNLNESISKDKEKMMVNFYKLCFVSGSMPLIHVWLFLSFMLSRLRNKWRQNPMKTKPLALVIESSNKNAGIPGSPSDGYEQWASFVDCFHYYLFGIWFLLCSRLQN